MLRQQLFHTHSSFETSLFTRFREHKNSVRTELVVVMQQHLMKCYALEFWFLLFCECFFPVAKESSGIV